MRKQYRIIQNEYLEGFKYNVQVLHERQSGSGEWVYGGAGRFCKTLDDAFAYIKEQEAETE